MIIHKKYLISFLVSLSIFLSGCGGNEDSSSSKNETKSQTIPPVQVTPDNAVDVVSGIFLKNAEAAFISFLSAINLSNRLTISERKEQLGIFLTNLNKVSNDISNSIQTLASFKTNLETEKSNMDCNVHINECQQIDEQITDIERQLETVNTSAGCYLNSQNFAPFISIRAAITSAMRIDENSNLAQSAFALLFGISFYHNRKFVSDLIRDQGKCPPPPPEST